MRDWNERLGPDATYALVSHADVIKAILADALGLHLDQFQRIVVSPASLSVVRYTKLRPFVLRVNDLGGDPVDLITTKKRTGGRRKPARTRGTCMTRRISTFDSPDRFIAGTVGEPGHRAFFLQARQGGAIVSVAAEKTQVAVLAANLAALLDTLAERGVEGIPADAGDRAIDEQPLGEPLVEAFRVGAMTIGWDSASRSS